MFSIDTSKTHQAFSTSSGVTSVFEKLRFRDELVWTIGLTVEIKRRFQISQSGVGWTEGCGKGSTKV